MIHQPLGGARGQASDIRIQADEILYLKDRLNQELSERSGQPLDRIQQDTDRDFFMSPAEAVAYGLIDAVIDKRPVQAVGWNPGCLVRSAQFVKDLSNGVKPGGTTGIQWSTALSDVESAKTWLTNQTLIDHNQCFFIPFYKKCSGCWPEQMIGSLI